LFLHLFDQLGGLVVADAKLALDAGGGTLAVFRHHGDGLIENE